MRMYRRLEDVLIRFRRAIPPKLTLLEAATTCLLLINFALIVVAVFFWDMFGRSWMQYLFAIDGKRDALEFLGLSFGGLILLFNAIALRKRADAQDRIAEAQGNTAKAQLQSNEQALFEKGIENLGHKSDSARLGGIYILFDLAAKIGERTQNIVEILCAHLRETTQRKDYQQRNKDRPSNEISSLLILLTGGRLKNCPVLDFSDAYLRGANLRRANLARAILEGANLQRADLHSANLKGAELGKAMLQKTVFVGASMQGADLCEAMLQESYFGGAELQFAMLCGSMLHGANLSGAKLHGANLYYANLQGAELSRAMLYGTDLEGAKLHGALLEGAWFYGAHLRDAELQGAAIRGAEFQCAELVDANFMGVTDYPHSFPQYFTFDEETFADRIRERVGKGTETATAFFGGGITQDEYEKVCAELEEAKQHLPELSSDMQERVLRKFADLEKNLAGHISEFYSAELPEEAIRGTLTKDMAEEIIAEYEATFDGR